MDTTFSGPQMGLIGDLMIVNFNSPHPFNFEGGEVLEACSPEWAKSTMLKVEEVESVHPGGWTDISISFHLTDEVVKALDALEGIGHVDVILVPFPMMAAIKAAGRDIGKCRCIRVKDRITKEIYKDRFCV